MEKRAINYQISKNKGLTPKRNKMCRNPRVKYRIKAHSASVKHKSIVPKVRSQGAKYAGEATGIQELLGMPNSSRNSEMFEKMNRKYEIIKCFIFSLKY